MSTLEERNIERVKLWEQTWNEDVMRMVDECYAEDCEVTDMLRDRTYYGRGELRLIEEQMMAADATRRMKIVNMVASGNTVVVETHSTRKGGEVRSKSCVVLVFNEEGLIISDHSYGGDPTGIAANDPRVDS
ncbi:MAG: nuclear transport factor 2 family protein [Gammaproteobacteria bacterium]|nr:nuclear transport factor 2 family protein [Gammaproteobacteria bacterium]